MSLHRLGARLTFPVFGNLRQSCHAPRGHHDSCKWALHDGNLHGSPIFSLSAYVIAASAG
jgi:hypothetical protein